MTNDLLDSTLASLDPAPHRVLDDTARLRANARREQILANDPRLLPATTIPPRRRRPWLAVAAGATAIASIVCAVAVGSLTPSDAAYASWTATPSALAAAERGLAGDACLGSGPQPGADVVLTERRGDWIAVAGVTEDHSNVACLVYLPVGSTDPSHVLWAGAGGEGALPRGGEFTEGSLAEFREWTIPGASTSPTASFAIGDVGEDVSALDILLPDGGVVHTTVAYGRYIAWWPGRVFTTDEDPGQPGPIDLDYRVTLRDGTVVEGAEPIRPE
jgi:hypothetical protein